MTHAKFGESRAMCDRRLNHHYGIVSAGCFFNFIFILRGSEKSDHRKYKCISAVWSRRLLDRQRQVTSVHVMYQSRRPCPN